MSPDMADSLAYMLTATAQPHGPDVAALAARMHSRILARREAQLRDLLGRWVSECDPAMALGANGQLLGLSHEGIIYVGMDLGEERG